MDDSEITKVTNECAKLQQMLQSGNLKKAMKSIKKMRKVVKKAKKTVKRAKKMQRVLMEEGRVMDAESATAAGQDGTVDEEAEFLAAIAAQEEELGSASPTSTAQSPTSGRPRPQSVLGAALANTASRQGDDDAESPCAEGESLLAVFGDKLKSEAVVNVDEERDEPAATANTAASPKTPTTATVKKPKIVAIAAGYHVGIFDSIHDADRIAVACKLYKDSKKKTFTHTAMGEARAWMTAQGCVERSVIIDNTTATAAVVVASEEGVATSAAQQEKVEWVNPNPPPQPVVAIAAGHEVGILAANEPDRAIAATKGYLKAAKKQCANMDEAIAFMKERGCVQDDATGVWTNPNPPSQEVKPKSNEKHFAVAAGQEVGIFDTFEHAVASTKGYKGGNRKMFTSRPEAVAWLKEQGCLHDEAADTWTNPNPPCQESKCYAVAAGYEIGIFDSYDRSITATKGYKGASKKQFNTRAEATAWMKEQGCTHDEESDSWKAPVKPEAPKSSGGLAKFGFVVKKTEADTPAGSGATHDGTAASTDAAAGSGNAAAAPEKKKLRFAKFVQSTRIIPAALRFWNDESCLEKASDKLLEKEEEAAANPATATAKPFIGNCIDFTKSTTQSTTDVPAGFNPEAVLVGWFSTQYDPVESRPPFFGTQNTVLADVNKFARFPAGDEMPQSNQFDYEYDSGDDWDSDGEGVDKNSSSDDDDEFDGSDDDGSDGADSFINDDDVEFEDPDDRDDHAAQARREERRARIRKKDKLVGVASGPYADVPLVNHPFQGEMGKEGDCMEFLNPQFSGTMIAKLLAIEANPTSASNLTVGGKLLGDAPAASPHPTSGRPKVTIAFCPPEVCEHLHKIMKEKTRAPTKDIVTLVRLRFLNEKKSVIERTVKKYYQWGKLAGWMPREKPLPDDDPQLRPQQTVKKTPQQATAPVATNGASAAATPPPAATVVQPTADATPVPASTEEAPAANVAQGNAAPVAAAAETVVTEQQQQEENSPSKKRKERENDDVDRETNAVSGVSAIDNATAPVPADPVQPAPTDANTATE